MWPHFKKETRILTEQQTELEVGSIRDSRGLEGVFRTLWERVKKAAELIEHLKEENRTLRSNTAQLEEQLSNLKNELMTKEGALREMNEERLQVLSSGDSLFSEQEREALKQRIRELIASINSHF